MYSFDSLAKRAIDPAFDVIAKENEGHPEFITSVQPDYSPSRSRCLLTISDKNVAGTSLKKASLTIKAGAGEIVFVERSCPLIDQGKPQPVTTLSYADVTRERIEGLTRAFIDQALIDLSQ